MNVNNSYYAFYAKEQFMQEKLTKSGQLMTVRFINRSQAQIVMHTNECFLIFVCFYNKYNSLINLNYEMSYIIIRDLLLM